MKNDLYGRLKLVEKAMFLHFRALTSNPYGMLFNDWESLGGGCLNHHNLREGLLALAALIQYRNSRWAVQYDCCIERITDTAIYKGGGTLC